MPSPPPDMDSNADERLSGDCWSDDVVGRLSDKGNEPRVESWLRLRSASFEDGGTGRIGIGRLSFIEGFAWFLLPNVKFAVRFSLVTDRTRGLNCSDKADTESPFVVSWLGWSSSIAELIHCHLQKRKNIDIEQRNQSTYCFMHYTYIYLLLSSLFQLLRKKKKILTHSFGGEIKETGSTTSPVSVTSSEKVLLSMTCNLSRRTSLHKVSRYTSPVSFTYLLQT